MDQILKMIDATKTTWSEVKKHSYDAVILPWGAIEPHNYHMPYLTDCILSKDIALESAILAYEKSKVTCMVLPPIYLGSQNPGQWNLPFCIHTNSETQKYILSDIVTSLSLQGFNKLVIINGHGGNTFKPMIRDLAVVHPNFYIIVVNWYDFVPKKGFFEEDPDDHAGEQETSVMMHYHPELINLNEAGDGATKPMKLESINNKTGWIPRNWAEVSEDTGIGNPKKSTAEKGKKYVAEVVERISDLLVELKDYNPST